MMHVYKFKDYLSFLCMCHSMVAYGSEGVRLILCFITTLTTLFYGFVYLIMVNLNAEAPHREDLPESDYMCI